MEVRTLVGFVIDWFGFGFPYPGDLTFTECSSSILLKFQILFGVGSVIDSTQQSVLLGVVYNLCRIAIREAV